MFPRWKRGKRAKVTSRRAIERKTPSAIRRCARLSSSGRAIARLFRATRRKRGSAKSSSPAYLRASQFARGSGVHVSESTTATAIQYSSVSRTAERRRMNRHCNERGGRHEWLSQIAQQLHGRPVRDYHVGIALQRVEILPAEAVAGLGRRQQRARLRQQTGGIHSGRRLIGIQRLVDQHDQLG